MDNKIWRSISSVDLLEQRPQRRRISADLSACYPGRNNLEVSVLVCFKGMDDLCLTLSREIVYQKLQASITDTLNDFIDGFILHSSDESSKEVSGDV